MIGSPVGALLASRRQAEGEVARQVQQITSRMRLLNIFDPCDPISYRIEPLVDSKLGELEPVVLEQYIEQLQSATTADDPEPSTLWSQINRTSIDRRATAPTRLDFQMTRTWRSLSNVSETIAATTAHRSYWKSQELVQLLAQLATG